MPRKLTKEDVERLLDRYHAGQCTPREIEIIEKWYRSYDGVDVPGLADAGKREEIRAAMREDIYKRIEGSEKGLETPRRLPVSRPLHIPNYTLLWRAAAVFLLTIGVGFYFYSADFSSPERGGLTDSLEDTPSQTNRTVQSAAPVLYLSDGSVVWLKGESRLEFPKDFGGTTREVTLIGEAFFDVARDPDRPFIIHSPSFKTRVLGTSFNIKDHAHQDLPEVAVISGKVMVSLDHNDKNKIRQLVLSPNKKVTYSKTEDTFVETQVDDVDVEAVAKRKLYFEETHLVDIIKVFNAEYDVNIRISHEALSGCVVTGDFTGLDMRVGLEALSKAINGQYAIDGRNIVISGPGCESQP